MTQTAKIIADSVSQETGKRITTFELEYCRFIHSEFMTHRTLSRNAASSRAIPVSSSIKLIKENTAMPMHWGKNQPGMSAKEECNEDIIIERAGGQMVLSREDAWEYARDNSIEVAEWFNDAGYHKQIVNRMLEPFSHIKVVMTATELDNFFWLRNHKDAQPEIQDLAEKMLEAYNASTPVQLPYGAWHLPYYENGYWLPNLDSEKYSTNSWILDKSELVDSHGNTLQDAIAISSSCCAQVSYRKLDDSLEKARKIYERLVEAMPPHFSPFEHQATPMKFITDFNTNGVTHLDKHGNYWSGNFCNWIQNRQLMMENMNMEAMTSKLLG